VIHRKDRSHSHGPPGEAAQVPLPAHGPGGTATLADCYAYCEQVARAHHENFPVASRFLPSRLRPHVLALYAFIRFADDYADEPEHEGQRGTALDAWEDQLRQAWEGHAEHPVFVALRDTQQRFDLPITPLLDLMSAFHTDLETRRFATWNDLRGYLDLAATPIGQLMLYLFGIRDPELHRFAEGLAHALALTNFWQDLAVDLGKNRMYLPQEDLRYFGVSEADLAARRESPALAELVRFQCARTRAEFERARPLVHRIDAHLGVEVALMWHGGHRALSKIEGRAHKVFGPRVTLSVADKGLALARALAERGSALPRRFWG
jgi:squalene synthase HpnC